MARAGGGRSGGRDLDSCWSMNMLLQRGHLPVPKYVKMECCTTLGLTFRKPVPFCVVFGHQIVTCTCYVHTVFKLCIEVGWRPCVAGERHTLVHTRAHCFSHTPHTHPPVSTHKHTHNLCLLFPHRSVHCSCNCFVFAYIELEPQG